MLAANVLPELGVSPLALTSATDYIQPYIIQSIDRKLSLEDIASAKGLNVDDLITEIETIVESGTKINLNYYLDDILDEYQQEELEDFYRTSEEASFEEARNEFDEDEYTDDELRLFRIKFISDVAN